jgi:hypothetical protein
MAIKFNLGDVKKVWTPLIEAPRPYERDGKIEWIIGANKRFRPYVETKTLARTQAKIGFNSEKCMGHLLHLVA